MGHPCVTWLKPAHLISDIVVVSGIGPLQACENIGKLTNGNVGKLHQITRLWSVFFVQSKGKPPCTDHRL